MKKIYKIADLITEMDTFGRTEKQAEKYLYEGETENIDIKIISNREQIARIFPSLSIDNMEYLATGSNFCRQIIQYGGVMIHSSAVVMNGKAYLFSAPSGTGKSTHTSLWVKVFGENNVYKLNDDKPVIRKLSDVWYAYGTPWSGKTAENANACMPIGGICLLSRGMENKITKCGGAEAIQRILMQMPRPVDMRDAILSLLDSVIRDIPIWKLECNMEPEAAIVAYEAMSGVKWEANDN